VQLVSAASTKAALNFALLAAATANQSCNASHYCSHHCRHCSYSSAWRCSSCECDCHSCPYCPALCSHTKVLAILKDTHSCIDINANRSAACRCWRVIKDRDLLQLASSLGAAPSCCCCCWTCETHTRAQGHHTLRCCSREPWRQDSGTGHLSAASAASCFGHSFE
jgi:hypothetical protein